MSADIAEIVSGARVNAAALMYVREAPWHGLGQRLDEAPTSAVAITTAGLDYSVSVDDLFTSEGTLCPFARVVRRDDNRAMLGSVGPAYKPIQNVEAFDFLDSLVGGDGLRYETAGALGIGERVWMLARTPGEMRVGKTDDIIHKYLLLTNTHDGTGAARCLFTPIRVVCQNTLRAALRDTESGVKIRHTGDVRAKLNDARATLGLSDVYFARMQEAANLMASKAMNSDRLRTYFEAVIPDPVSTDDKPATPRQVAAVAETRSQLHELFESGNGADIKGVRGTLWVAYNAVTEYVDQVKPTAMARGASLEDRRSTRLDSIWFGQGAALKGRAFAEAMAYASN